MAKTESGRPDFRGFANSLREEASWIQTLHADDKTGQTQVDAGALIDLAKQVEDTGIKMSYIIP